MVCVSQYDLGFYVILELIYVHCLDRTYSAHRHEYGSPDNSVVCGYLSGTGVAGGVSVLKLECQCFVGQGFTFGVL